jgi:hypothetical protein
MGFFKDLSFDTTKTRMTDYLTSNPGASDASIAKAMETLGVSPSDMSKIVGVPEGEIAARVAATVSPGMSVTLGDTVVAPQYRTTGSGMDEQIGALETFTTSKTTGDPNYKAPVGTPVNIYSPTGELVNTVKTKKDLSFFGGVVDMLKDPVVQAAALGVAGGAGVFDSLLGPAAGSEGIFLGEGVASGVPAFDAAFTSAGGTFNPAFGLPVGNGAFLGEGVPTGIPASDAAYLKAGGTFNPAFALGADGLVGAPTAVNALIPPVVVPPGGAPPVVTPPVVTPPVVTPPGGVPPVIPTNLASLATPLAIAATALTGADAAKSAAQTQADSAREANALLYKMYQEQKGLQEPFRGAGITAQNRLLDLLGLSKNRGAEGFGKYAKDFSMSDFTADPGYAFRLAEGQKTLDRQAAARGGLISGGALKAATRYGQDMGSQEYQNAFNRYQTNRANQLQPLGSLLTSGQAAASNQSAAAGNYGTQAGGNITGAGAATAAGQVGSTNALTNALSSYLNYSSSQNMADAIRKSTYGA